jgi:acyl-CoA thioester hydrolase
MPVVLHHRVRYHETDAQGFLFNSRFLEIADVALTEFVRSVGWPYARLLASGVDPSVVNAALHFQAPARFEDLLDVDVTCPHVGTSSFRLHIVLTRDDSPIALMDLTYVNVAPATATSRPIPIELAEALSANHAQASAPNTH